MKETMLWNEQKNDQLFRRHGIRFEDVVIALEQGGLLDNREHPNSEKYGNQRQLIVKINDYAVIVPYVHTAEGWFLKTLFPSRQATKYYLLTGLHS